jgi:hypothetical protein
MTPGLPPALTAPLGSTAPLPPRGGPPIWGGFPSHAIPGNAGIAPPGVIMPPGNYGPPGDPLGIGPVNGFNSLPAPMYPMPGAPGMQSWQPSAPMPYVKGAEDGLGGGGIGYGNAPHWWFDAEYLLWFTNGQPVRFPLLTTGAPSEGGVLGATTTTVLVGNRDLGYNAMNGYRLTGGFFGDADRRFGFEISGFMIERASNIQSFGTVGNPALSGIPTLSRPFIDAVTGAQSAIVLSGPDFGAAQVVVGTTTQTWGIEPLGVWNLYRSEPGCRAACSIDFLAGYRYLQIKEELFINSRTDLDNAIAFPTFTTGPFGVITQLPATNLPVQTTFGGTTIGGGASLIIRDQFRALNQFNGLTLGLRGEGRYGMITVSSYAKASIGNMHERVDILGSGSFNDPSGRSGTTAGVLGGFNLGVGGGLGSSVGGVLANSGNIGTFTHDRFTVIPEVGGNLGIAVTRGLTAYMGVTALYFPDIVRPGDLVNPIVNSATIPFSPNFGTLPGTPRNAGVVLRETSHWLGGVNFGFKLRY